MSATLIAISSASLAGTADTAPASAPTPAAANADVAADLNLPLPRAGEGRGEGAALDRIEDSEAAQRAAKR